MAQLIGEWKIESSENFDEYMKVMGESNFKMHFLIYFFQFFKNLILDEFLYLIYFRTSVKFFNTSYIVKCAKQPNLVVLFGLPRFWDSFFYIKACLSFSFIH